MKYSCIEINECIKFAYLDMDVFELVQKMDNVSCFGMFTEKEDVKYDIEIDRFVGLIIIENGLAHNNSSIVYMNVIEEYREFVYLSMFLDSVIHKLKDANIKVLLYEFFEDTDGIEEFLYTIGFLDSNLEEYEMQYYLSDIEDCDIYQMIIANEKYTSNVTMPDDEDNSFSNFRKRVAVEQKNKLLYYADKDSSRVIIKDGRITHAMLNRKIDDKYIYYLGFYSSDNDARCFPLLLVKSISDLSNYLDDEAMLIMKFDNYDNCENIIQLFGNPDVFKKRKMIFRYID